MQDGEAGKEAARADQRNLQPLPALLQARYRIRRVLGTGGMSTVYVAFDPLLDREVAVKVFTLPAVDPEDLRAQQAEARLVASLNHHALTSLFDAGVDVTDPQRPQIYLVMEYIPGPDLKRKLQDGPLTAMQVAYLGFDLAEGLAAVHAAGFVHHDIKPANVLLADREAGVRLRGKLTDFGISTLIGKSEGTEYTNGTAAYLAPEQVEGKDASPATDVYSLGLVLLEALTGQVAFPGSIQQSAFARLDHDPVIPTSVPWALVEVLTGMTARRPQDRLALPEIAMRFQTILVDELIRARGIQPDALVADEAARAAAVRRYDVLDTPSDDAFDTVTRLAAHVLSVPIAIVTIIDTDRVWFKSRRGIEATEVDRNTAFCSTTGPGDGQPWAVPDALADPDLRTNALVTGDPHVRAYAAAPLMTRDHHQLGALCVFDTRPRDFTEQELTTLADLAGIVMRELELRLASRRAIFNQR